MRCSHRGPLVLLYKIKCSLILKIITLLGIYLETTRELQYFNLRCYYTFFDICFFINLSIYLCLSIFIYFLWMLDSVAQS